MNEWSTVPNLMASPVSRGKLEAAGTWVSLRNLFRTEELTGISYVLPPVICPWVFPHGVSIG